MPSTGRTFGRPLRLKKCLYSADFRGKSWYDTLHNFLQENMSFHWSRVEGCLYVYRIENDWIKIINYVDDALYFASNDKVREHFELTLKNKVPLDFDGRSKMVPWNAYQTTQGLHHS